MSRKQSFFTIVLFILCCSTPFAALSQEHQSPIVINRNTDHNPFLYNVKVYASYNGTSALQIIRSISNDWYIDDSGGFDTGLSFRHFITFKSIENTMLSVSLDAGIHHTNHICNSYLTDKEYNYSTNHIILVPVITLHIWNLGFSAGIRNCFLCGFYKDKAALPFLGFSKEIFNKYQIYFTLRGSYKISIFEIGIEYEIPTINNNINADKLSYYIRTPVQIEREEVVNIRLFLYITLFGNR